MANRRPLVLVDGRRKELPFVDSLPGSVIEAYQGRNHIINGGFDVWQRGLSATAVGYQAADRFVHNVGGNAAATMNRIALLPEDFPAGVFSPSAACRIVINSNGTDTVNNFITLQHRAENLARFSNRLLHYGMWVRVNNPGLKVVFEATADPGPGGNSNGGVSNTIGVKTFTIAQANVWTFCPNPFQFPSVRGFSIVSPELSSLRYNVWMSAGTAHNSRNQNLGFQPANSVFDFAMMQLEYGSAPSAFEVLPYAQHYALCRRYAQVYRPPGGMPFLSCTARFANQVIAPMPISPMRITPAVSTSGTLTTVLAGIGYNASAVVGTGSSPDAIYLALTIANATPGHGGYLYATPNSEFSMTLDAEI
ncbi:putative tail fiber protein [Xanthomonas phage FoX4]|uniref:Putative tail fiber protein n=1 Tax=Xanthomonas phage FoX4 TaxID=2723900 RepID=A0A858WP19_9CAUD|nr:tail fiber protein [Xanthomonas phage FoX4]QJI52998.1 putative tail fiber protein [Xanthomonas phage FoX4]